jgi:hypothetical protein
METMHISCPGVIHFISLAAELSLTFAAPAVFRESATVKPFSCNVAGGKTAE